MESNLRTVGQASARYTAEVESWSAVDEIDRRELTPRQREILAFIARGQSNKEIAFALGIRERTVKFHVASLFERLGTSSRTEALVVALRLGVIQINETA
jgi:two-component system nitrate/nitrite response regulator NarL